MLERGLGLRGVVFTAMQTVGLRAASSTASLCWGESFLAGTSSSSCSDGISALLSLRGGRRAPPASAATCAGTVAPRAVLSQRQESGSAAVRDKGDVRAQSSTFTEPLGRNFLSAEQRVYEAVAKQVAIVEREQSRSRQSSLLDVRPDLTPVSTLEMLDEAYTRCGEVCAEYAKTFYLGTKSHLPSPTLAMTRVLVQWWKWTSPTALHATYYACVFLALASSCIGTRAALFIRIDSHICCFFFFPPNRNKADDS